MLVKFSKILVIDLFVNAKYYGSKWVYRVIYFADPRHHLCVQFLSRRMSSKYSSCISCGAVILIKWCNAERGNNADWGNIAIDGNKMKNAIAYIWDNRKWLKRPTVHFPCVNQGRKTQSILLQMTMSSFDRNILSFTYWLCRLLSQRIDHPHRIFENNRVYQS